VTVAEPGVTLSDYALAVECAVFVWLLSRVSLERGSRRAWFVLFFAATAVAAIAGGTTHGFMHDESATGYRVSWTLTLLAVGVAALAAWAIGALMLPGASAARWARKAGLGFFVVYCLVVLGVSNSFVVAIAYYLPATALLLFGFGFQYRSGPAPHLLAGIVGVLLTFAAAGVQQSGLAVHPVWLNHNVLYHLIQAAALLLLYRAARSA